MSERYAIKPPYFQTQFRKTCTARQLWQFVKMQVRLTRAGGIRAVSTKILELAKLFMVMPLAVSVWLLRPLVIVRFGRLETSRIGHLAGNTEMLLCERDLGLHGKNTVDVFYHFYQRGGVCNEQLKSMWDRTLIIHPWAEYLHKINRYVPIGAAHSLPFGLACQHDRDVYGILARTKPHLAFTSEEMSRGCQAIQEMGIGKDDLFVCFHARDPLYLAAALPGLDMSYQAHRDSTIANYITGIDMLTRRGYFGVRMGAVVADKLATTNARIIDYATNGMRNDFMDIFLAAHCTFFVACGAGIDSIATVFRRPTVYVNHIPLEYVKFWEPGHLFIPKKLWSKEQRRFLTFRETLDSGVGRLLHAHKYQDAGIEVIENRPDEITAVVLEMAERLNGTWQTSDEDEELQCRFLSLFKPNELNKVFLARIGAAFLRENLELLD